MEIFTQLEKKKILYFGILLLLTTVYIVSCSIKKKIKTPLWLQKTVHSEIDVIRIEKIVLDLEEELIFSKLLPLKGTKIDENNALELFEKSYRVIDEYSIILQNNLSLLNAYLYLGKDINMKSKIQESLSKIEDYILNNFTYNKDIYSILKEVGTELLKREDLAPNKKKLIEDALKDYETLGIYLPEVEQQKLKEIGLKLTNLCLDFGQNIQKSTNHIVAKKDELSGLTTEQLEKLDVQDSGEYKIGVDYPTYDLIMSNCDNSEIRKKLYIAYNTRAYPENVTIFEKIRTLCDEKSHILGYPNFTEFSLAFGMAKNVETVEHFLKEINKVTIEKATKEKQLLTEFTQKELFRDENYLINPWDVAYICKQYEKSHFAIDQDTISEYFPVRQTIEKLINLYSRFFDLKMEVISYDDESWKYDSSMVVLRISKNNIVLGDLIMDLYPRTGKYSHACFSPLIGSPLYANDSKKELTDLPIGCIIANFNKPTKDHDGLLKYSEVRTFFHEFGHALHYFFSVSEEFFSQSGISVSSDFIETPSQLFEQWLLQESILKDISEHYQTKEKLPDEIVTKIIGSEFYSIGLDTQRQINLAELSLEIFKNPKKDISLIREELSEKIVSLSYIDLIHNQYVYSFGHLASLGLYGAKYYGYLWSLVYAIDFFQYIKEKNGLLDKNMGEKLITTVLSKGSSQDENKLIENFLERKPSLESLYAYLKR